MLGNTIALFTLALMLASEGKRTDGAWRAGLFTLATVVALVALALKPITNALPAVGTFLTAIFGNPLSWFMLFMALFFVLRPFWQRRNSPPALQEGPDRVGESLSVAGKLLTEHGEEIAKLSATVPFLQEQQKAIQVTLSNLGGSIEKLREAVSSELAEIRRGCVTIVEKVDKNEKGLREALHAIYARERMAELARSIELDAAELIRKVQAGETIDEKAWDSWESIHHHWEESVKEWMGVARWYAEDVQKNVLTVKDEEYDGILLNEDLFPPPRADRVRRFKKHFIIQRHWTDLRHKVELGALQVAFFGMTEREMHNGKFHQ